MKSILFRRSSFGFTVLILLIALFVQPVSADTTVGGTISTDTTWTLANSPYVVSSNITILGTDGADGVTTLTIEAGVLIKANMATNITVGSTSTTPGALNVQGTANDPVVFTSNATTPAPSDWYGIRFYPTTSASTILDHAVVQYAGYGNKGSIYLYSSSPTISDTQIENSGHYDIYAYGATAAQVTGCTLNSGLYLSSSSTINFDGNEFNYNATWPSLIYADHVGSVTSNNSFNYPVDVFLEVASGEVTKDATWGPTIPICLKNNLFIRGTDGPDNLTTLTIEAGTELRFNATRYLSVSYVNGNPGALIVQGTAANPVVFTSNSTSPAPGDWDGVRFYGNADTSSTMNHAIVKYAGYSGYGSIYLNKAGLTISNTTVENGANYDLNVSAIGGTVQNCTFNRSINLTSSSLVDFTGNTFNYIADQPSVIYADQVGSLTTDNIFNYPDEVYLTVTSGNVTKDATWGAAIPISFNNNVSVIGTDGSDGVTTLTIESGAQIRFNAQKVLEVGYSYGSPGALVAIGTSEDPIVFSSNSADPAPGDWYGIRLRTTTDPSTIIEHAVIEYAGYGSQGSLNISNPGSNLNNLKIENGYSYDLYTSSSANATVQQCTFNSGIYLYSNCSLDFSGNVFNYNTDRPSLIYADHVGSLLTGNTFNYPPSTYLEVISGNVTKDATWTSAVPVRFKNNVAVQGTDGDDNLTTLTIEPGTCLHFDAQKYLSVGYFSGDPGAMIVQGTATAPVIFTSSNATPAAGDWSGLRLYTTAAPSTIIEYAIVQYAGYDSNGSIYIYASNPALNHVTIEEGGNYDLNISANAGAAINYCLFNSGINIPNGSIATFSNNLFNYNGDFPTKVYSNDVNTLVNDNTFNYPESVGLEVIGGDLTRDAVWTAAVPIYLANNLIIWGTDGDDGVTTLVLEPGAILKINNQKYISIGYLSNPGALIAQGTSNDPVVFTSNKETPAAGDWSGISFQSTAEATSTLSHCQIQYAGYSNTSAFTINGSSPTLDHVVFENNMRYDLVCNGASQSIVSNCTFHNSVVVSANESVDFSDNTFNYYPDFKTTVNTDNVASLLTDNVFSNYPADACIEVTGTTLTKDAVWPPAVPLCLPNDLIVSGVDGQDNVATLTIQRGSKLKFGYDEFLYVGSSSGDPGALIAEGTEEHPITFTSDQASPTPGAWRGVYFYPATHNVDSSLNNCIIEYAVTGANVQGIRPTIRKCIFRNNSQTGIYFSGASCANVDVQCNLFQNNVNGIAASNNALPDMQFNNFDNNSAYGIQNYSTGVTLFAENNWWGDSNGPNQSGDGYYGLVDADPWSTAENDCDEIVVNNPPNEPSTPFPGNEAVRVETEAGVTLSWNGSDPDPLDIVTYDVYIGTTEDGLLSVVQDQTARTHDMAIVIEGQTYYWKIVCRDSHGLEATGPVWHFTTTGEPPDLVVSGITPTPAGHLQTGQTAVFTVTVSNTGSGPSVDPFSIDLNVGGAVVDIADIYSVLLSGQSVEATLEWTYSSGNPGIAFDTDSQNEVAESDEQNNQYTADLFDIIDNTAPVLTGTQPTDNNYIIELETISIVLSDSQSAVDTTAVMVSLSVEQSGVGLIAGTSDAFENTIIFTPDSLPMPDGQYSISLTASDTWGNNQPYQFGFTIDSQPPTKPVITGGAVDSGTIQPQPVQNISNQFTVELTGTREAQTSVWINGEQQVPLGDADWSVSLVLEPEFNTYEIKLKDIAGNQGPSEWVDIEMSTSDTIELEYNTAGRLSQIRTDQQ